FTPALGGQGRGVRCRVEIPGIRVVLKFFRVKPEPEKPFCYSPSSKVIRDAGDKERGILELDGCLQIISDSWFARPGVGPAVGQAVKQVQETQNLFPYHLLKQFFKRVKVTPHDFLLPLA
ncbi:MAG: hypothetical protein AAB499_02855, partial [Patescibacteria group bacterium]